MQKEKFIILYRFLNCPNLMKQPQIDPSGNKLIPVIIKVNHFPPFTTYYLKYL